MHVFFDFEQILNHQDPINDHKFRNIFNQYNKNLTFQDKLCLAWTETYKCYPQKSKTIFNLNDESFKNQFLTELLLQLFNTLSLYNPERIFGVDNFLESTQFLNSNKPLVYKNKTSFNSFVEHLRPCQPDRLKYDINASISEDSPCYIPIHPTAKSDLILENTPLYDFIFTHLSTKTDSPNHQIPRTSCDKENTKTKYYFNKEGRYFLSVLLLAVASKNIPYTDKSIPGVSLHSINNLFDTFYYAYHQEELTNNLTENLLFFINTECLFQPSFLNRLFSALSECFSMSKDIAISTFITLFHYIPSLVNFPLNIVKINIFDSFYQIITNIYKNSHENTAIYLWFNDIIKEMNEIEEMISFFIYLLLLLTDFTSNSKNSSILPTLKKDIFNYLSKAENRHMQWSILTSSSKTYTAIPSTFNKYFDFYTLFAFYNCSTNLDILNWTSKDKEYALAWPEYNAYTKYILKHKK